MTCACTHEKLDHAAEATSTRCMMTSCPCREFKIHRVPKAKFFESLSSKELARALVEANMRIEKATESYEAARVVYDEAQDTYDDLHKRLLNVDDSGEVSFLVKMGSDTFAVSIVDGGDEPEAVIRPVEEA